MLKRINAAISLLTTLALFAHIGICFNYDAAGSAAADVIPTVLLALVMVHGVLSMLIFTLCHDGNDTRYARLNLDTLLQRLSGTLMLFPLFISHLRIYGGGQSDSLLYALSEFLFFLLVGVHLAVSLPKALITLGVLPGERSMAVARVLAALLGLAVCVAGVMITLAVFSL